MRITRIEEYCASARARPASRATSRWASATDGKLLAADLYIVQENGPHIGFGDFRTAGNALSIVYQPDAMRFRGVPVLTNTPPRGPQRGPGENQIVPAIEPMIDKAARQLGIDRLAIRRINAPDTNGKIGADRGPVTSAFLKEALDKGATMFNWEEKKKRSGQTQRHQGHRHRHRPGLSLGRLQRLRRPVAHHAGRQAPHPHRRRQSRHLLAFGTARVAAEVLNVELGQRGHRARRQPARPALEHHPGRQPHRVHPVAHQCMWRRWT